MAETEKGKKIVYVHEYKRTDGTTVPTHERSAPTTSRAAARTASATSAAEDYPENLQVVDRQRQHNVEAYSPLATTTR